MPERARKILYICELALAAPFLAILLFLAIIGLLLGFVSTVTHLLITLLHPARGSLMFVAFFGAIVVSALAGMTALFLLGSLSEKYLSNNAGRFHQQKRLLLVAVALSFVPIVFFCSGAISSGREVKGGPSLGYLLYALPAYLPLLHLTIEGWLSWRQRPRAEGVVD